jgi:arylsulfatase A-like enzyme
MPPPDSSKTQPSRRNVLAGAAALISGVTASTAATSRPPNILYIHSHDSGRYVSPYGHAIPTPNIEQLASEGILFRAAFSGAPTCSPSRACLLTGQCAHRNGMLGLAHRGFSLHDYSHHVLYTLRRAGYYSVLAGLQHIAAKPETIGYDEILHHRSLSAVDVAPAAVEYLDRRPKQPFFLDVGFRETHREYPAPTPSDNPKFTTPPRAVPDRPETRQDMAAYHASARVMDRGVGEVLAALERNGFAESTLVINTTDHGIAFPRMKCNLTDDGWGISLIMRGPGGFRGGKDCDALISQLDIFPTLCELAGVERPEWLEGKSILPIIQGRATRINEEVFAEVNYHAAYEPKRAVRTSRWKYIRRFGGRRKPVLPNCDDSLSKNVWLEYGWKNRILAEEELYDLIFDPAEQNNLASAPAYRQACEEMKCRLDRWMKATNDPLLYGPVVAPQGALVNNPDGTSPKEATIRIS